MSSPPTPGGDPGLWPPGSQLPVQLPTEPTVRFRASWAPCAVGTGESVSACVPARGLGDTIPYPFSVLTGHQCGVHYWSFHFLETEVGMVESLSRGHTGLMGQHWGLNSDLPPSGGRPREPAFHPISHCCIPSTWHWAWVIRGSETLRGIGTRGSFSARLSGAGSRSHWVPGLSPLVEASDTIKSTSHPPPEVPT